jgi:hypothetical protein
MKTLTKREARRRRPTLLNGTVPRLRKMLARLAVAAKFQFPVHPHMHACGYKLANDGRKRALQHYLGTTTSCTWCVTPELSPERFKIAGGLSVLPG